MGNRPIAKVDVSEATESTSISNLDDSCVYLTVEPSFMGEDDGVTILSGKYLQLNGQYLVITELSKKDIAFLFATAFRDNSLNTVLQALENARSEVQRRAREWLEKHPSD